MDLQKRNYYIEEPEMVQQVIFSIINMIIKVQRNAYIKMKKGIFLKDILQFLGQ